MKISSILGHYLNKKILLDLYQTRYFQIRTHPKLNFYFERISRLAQHLVKISYILEHYSKKILFLLCFPIPSLNTRYFLIGNSSELNFFFESWPGGLSQLVQFSSNLIGYFSRNLYSSLKIPHRPFLNPII